MDTSKLLTGEKIPLGKWARDKRMKEIGFFQQHVGIGTPYETFLTLLGMHRFCGALQFSDIHKSTRLGFDPSASISCSSACRV